MVEVSPFPYQGPLVPGTDVLRGRDDLLDDLLARVSERRVAALLGPRRYGKTSVLNFLGHRLRDAGTCETVSIDLFGAETLTDFVVAVDTALDTAPGPIRRAASRIAATVDINLGVFRFGFGRVSPRPDPETATATLIDTLVRTALEQPTLIVIDEFQQVANLGSVAAQLRTRLQHHYRDVGLVFAGSEPSTMEHLFSDSRQAFFQQADRIRIGPLDLGTTVDIVTDGFEATGRDPGRAANLIHHLTGGHPKAMMRVADAVWRNTPDGGHVDDQVWADGIEHVRGAVADEYAAVWAKIRGAEQLVLRLIADSQPLYGTLAKAIGLAKSTATRATEVLVRRGDVIDHGDGLAITDPLFGDWIRRVAPV